MTCGVNENGYSTRLLVPLLQPSQNDFAPSNTVRYYLNGHRQQRLATLRERNARKRRRHCSWRSSLKERPVPGDPNDSPDANRGEEGHFFGVANEDCDEQCGARKDTRGHRPRFNLTIVISGMKPE